MTHAPHDGEAKINRALRHSAAVAGAAAIIGAGAYLISTMPRGPVVDGTQPSGPSEVKTQRANVASSLPAIPFTDVAMASGIDCLGINGAKGGKLLPETMGGGVALFDANSDGRLDIAFCTGSDWSGEPFASAPRATPSTLRLFLNQTDSQSGSPLKFQEALSCGLDSTLYAMGLAVGDYDSDGRADLFVTGVGRNELYRNESRDSAVVFRNTTAEALVDPVGSAPRWGTSCGFFDADRDGDLDLLIVNYVRWSVEIDRAVDFRLAGVGRAYGPPTGFEGEDVLFMRNLGNGTFEDATKAAGFATKGALGQPTGKGLGLVFVDPDQDGDLDAVIANDTVAKCYFVNDGSGKFTEEAAARGIAFDRNGAATGAMGIDAGYLRSIAPDRRSDLAIAIGNFANEPDALYISRGTSGLFSDDAIVEGLAAPTRGVLTFGLVMEDLDLDGDLDIAQANGHIEDEIGRIQVSQSYAQRGQVFVNTQSSAPCLVELPPQSIGDMALPRVGRALACGDLDLDGDADLVMTQSGGRAAVLRNDSAVGHHWLRVRLVGTRNTVAIGAQVEVQSGESVQRRLISPTRSYLSQCQTDASFGLGSASRVDRVTVRWPSGAVDEIKVDGVDRLITVRAKPN